MPAFSFEGQSPSIHPEAFVAPTATLIGDVRIGPGASVWYGAILRADYDAITVGARANIQDATVVHTSPGLPAIIGEGATVGHGCTIHAATIGEGSLLGNASMILDGATMGTGCVVGAYSLVTAGKHISPGMFAIGRPAQEMRPVAGSDLERLLENNAPWYVELAQRHMRGIERIEGSDE